MTALDAALVTRGQAGDQAAFVELVARHGGPAWRIASALSATPADAERAVVDAFTAVFRQLDAGTISTSTSFRVLVTRATVDEVLHADPNGTTSLEPADNPLLAVFRTLPLQWRAVLWLTVAEGGSTAQVGALLSQSADAIARLVPRAQAGLRARYLAAGGQRHDDLLDDQRTALRPLVAPMPASLAGTALAAWLDWRNRRDRRGIAGIAALGSLGPWAERAVAGAAAAVITAGIAAAVALGGKEATDKSVAAAPAGSGELAAGATGAGPTDGGADAVPSTPPSVGPSSNRNASAGATTPADGHAAGSTVIASTAPKITGPSTTPSAPGGTNDQTPTAPADGVTITADLPGVPVGVNVGPTPGITIGPETVGTPPPVDGNGVSVSVSVPGLPPIVVHVP